MPAQGNWWETQPKRFLREFETLRDFVASDEAFGPLAWEMAGSFLVVRGSLKGKTHEWPFVLTYPDLFPRVCPYIRPQDRTGRWSPHQFGEGGSLCLELGPDNWKEENTGADLLRSMKALLLFEEEHPPGESSEQVESRHATTQGQELRYDYYRVLNGNSLRDALKGKAAYGKCTFGASVSAEACMLWPKEAPDGERIAAPYGLSHATKLSREGRFFQLTLPEEAKQTEEYLVFYEIVDLVIEKYLDAEALKLFREAPKDSIIALLIADGPLLVYRISDDGEKRRLKVVPAVDASDVARVPSELRKTLAEKKVSIVGLGSVGSKVAVTLARSGVRSFVFIDDDVLKFGNIARHEATFEDVGAHKVDVINDLVHQVSISEPTIVKHKTRLLGQGSARNYSECMNDLVSSDIIVDCTADAEVFRYLGAIASDGQRKFAWAEVFAGGIGGLVGLADPAKTPCPTCIRRASNDYFSSLPEAPSKRAEGDYSDGTVEADDNAVGILANLLALRVKQSLVNNTVSAAAPVWLVGLEEKWVFNFPMDIRQVAARTDDYSCSACWRASPAQTTLTDTETTAYEKAIGQIPKSESK